MLKRLTIRSRILLLAGLLMLLASAIAGIGWYAISDISASLSESIRVAKQAQFVIIAIREFAGADTARSPPQIAVRPGSATAGGTRVQRGGTIGRDTRPGTTGLATTTGLAAAEPAPPMADADSLPEAPKPEADLGSAAVRHSAALQRIGEAVELVVLNPSGATLGSYATALQTLGDTPPGSES